MAFLKCHEQEICILLMCVKLYKFSHNNFVIYQQVSKDTIISPSKCFDTRKSRFMTMAPFWIDMKSQGLIQCLGHAPSNLSNLMVELSNCFSYF